MLCVSLFLPTANDILSEFYLANLKFVLEIGTSVLLKPLRRPLVVTDIHDLSLKWILQ